jgi:xanthine/CO dehydrogenase XdhC/CoxF family maturation factor
MTHRHDLDLAIAQSLLREGRCASLGVIGSKPARQRPSASAWHIWASTPRRCNARPACPASAARSRPLIAVAVVAELLQLAQAGSAKR